MSHVTRHSHASQCLLYINSVHRLYNTTALDQLPLSSQLVPSTQQVSRSSSSSTYIGIASTYLSTVRLWTLRKHSTLHGLCAVQTYKYPYATWSAVEFFHLRFTLCSIQELSNHLRFITSSFEPSTQVS